MKAFRLHLLCAIFTLLCTCVSAQNNEGAAAGAMGRIEGDIAANGAAAEFINILLVATRDSSVVKLELSDETGHFAFTDVPAAEYLIRTSGIGYDAQDHPAFMLDDGAQLRLPSYDIGGGSTMLETVEVIARKPLLEQRAGVLVVNVDQAITGQGGSVIDLLRKVPGVVIAGNRVMMAGKSGLTILIDGRPTKYMDIQSLLRDMPADNIKSIEVISQPGADYDAEGAGGVINLVLKKNSLLGTNGEVYLGGGYGEEAKYRAGFSLTHQSGKINLTGGASYNRRSYIDALDLVRRFEDRTYDQRNVNVGLPNNYAVRTGIDYDISERQRAGVNVSYNWGQSNYTGTNETELFDPQTGRLLQAFTTNTEMIRPQSGFNGDAFYRIKLDTSGQEVNVDASYNYFDRNGRFSLVTTGDGNFPDRQNLEPSSASIISGQVDYKKPIGRLLLRAGTKASRAQLDNELAARLRENGELVTDVNLSNRFLYDENITAAYTSLAWEKGDFSANVGLRYEATKMEGYNETVDSFNRREFSQLFPSVSFSAPAFGPVGVAVAYSYRIERPDYYTLNPFVSYLDPLTFKKGNPFLRPELVHSGQLSLTYRKQPFFNLSYDYTRDVIADVTEQDNNSGVAFENTVNLDKYVRYGGSLFAPLDFIAQPVSGYAGVTFHYNDYSSEYLGGQLDQDRWSLTGFFQLSALLPYGWKGEVSGWYQGKGFEGIIRTDALYGVSAGLERDFFDDRLNLVLSGDGIIQKFFSGTIRYQQQDLDLRSRWEAPVFSAKITYKFGNRFMKRVSDRESAAREERGRLGE